MMSDKEDCTESSAMQSKFHKQILEFAEKELSYSVSNMDHVLRVYGLCAHLAKDEPGIDWEILDAAVLLHDIARAKEDEDDSGKIDHAIFGASVAERILRDIGFPPGKIEGVKHCILTHRFRTTGEPKTMEAKILFDADKLDILGAIGIGRSFMIAGVCNEKMYSDVPLEEYTRKNMVGGDTRGRIKNITKHSPNLEFEMNLRHITEKMHTKKAKAIAEERLKYMGDFFSRLKKEISGDI